MIDPRVTDLAELIVNYSTRVKSKERVLIVLYGTAGIPLLKELYKLCIKKGAYVSYDIAVDGLGQHFYANAKDHQLTDLPKHALAKAKVTDVMIQIVADSNKMSMAKVDQKKMLQSRKARKKLSDYYHDKRWTLLRYPTNADAQDAGMSLDDWEDFVFNSCLVDWKKVRKEQEVLEKILKKTKEIRLVADETDLLVKVKGQKYCHCCGEFNLPDGEIFTSPIRTGVDGVIKYNTPTMYMGKEFNWIKLWFEKGKVVKAESDKNQADLIKILDTDKGSRYLGEFAFGTNPFIQQPVKSILFDEKIGGSNHMALGKCYDKAPNGNDSAIHWDLILRHEYANGKVYLDGVLVQEKGLWIHKDLKKFNPKKKK